MVRYFSNYVPCNTKRKGLPPWIHNVVCLTQCPLCDSCEDFANYQRNVGRIQMQSSMENVGDNLVFVPRDLMGEFEDE